MDDIVNVETANTFLSTFGSNVGTMLVGLVAWILYQKCGKSRCNYSTSDGLNMGFGDHDVEDSEDEHLKEIYDLLKKRKSMKLDKHKLASRERDDKKKATSESFESNSVRIAIEKSIV